MLNVDPQRRPTINQILATDFITERIEDFLSESVVMDEFKHTILHGQSLVALLNEDLPDDGSAFGLQPETLEKKRQRELQEQEEQRRIEHERMEEKRRQEAEVEQFKREKEALQKLEREKMKLREQSEQERLRKRIVENRSETEEKLQVRSNSVVGEVPKLRRKSLSSGRNDLEVPSKHLHPLTPDATPSPAVRRKSNSSFTSPGFLPGSEVPFPTHSLASQGSSKRTLTVAISPSPSPSASPAPSPGASPPFLSPSSDSSTPRKVTAGIRLTPISPASLSPSSPIPARISPPSPSGPSAFGFPPLSPSAPISSPSSQHSHARRPSSPLLSPIKAHNLPTPSAPAKTSHEDSDSPVFGLSASALGETVLHAESVSSSLGSSLRKGLREALEEELGQDLVGTAFRLVQNSASCSQIESMLLRAGIEAPKAIELSHILHDLATREMSS
eukprot:GILI01021557.1.p1 GENE.GILI01021557.1~~GILI01021557.1.p1  ORF type:complete len:516 (+),score=85.79 GILI01021557.1:211-1548(+)